jgi:hypothetical protein
MRILFFWNVKILDDAFGPRAFYISLIFSFKGKK